ncbi:MAG: hypothetical protein ABI724_10420 [Betaproteobacteria bacterium]
MVIAYSPGGRTPKVKFPWASDFTCLTGWPPGFLPIKTSMSGTGSPGFANADTADTAQIRATISDAIFLVVSIEPSVSSLPVYAAETAAG